MPRALKIFGLSLLAGVVGTFAGTRIGWWIGTGFMMRELVDFFGAGAFGIVFGLAFGAASAVTTGVVLGKRLRAQPLRQVPWYRRGR